MTWLSGLSGQGGVALGLTITSACHTDQVRRKEFSPHSLLTEGRVISVAVQGPQMVNCVNCVAWSGKMLLM